MQLINVHCTIYLFLVTQNLERKADIMSYSAVFDRLLIVKGSYFIYTSWRHLQSCPSGIFFERRRSGPILFIDTLLPNDMD